MSSFVIGHSSLGQERKPISVGQPEADVSPAAEQATFKVLDGFEVNLFASEADGVPNPLVLRWDERGRLWVVCPLSYPQPVPGEPLKDRILILEDTDHDGKADKVTVFADGLSMPTGLELAPAKSPKGHSVYVGMGEKLLLMHDLDGDDKVDETETVLSGFGTGDAHQNINSFVWSPDGTLVMHQGLHCYSRVATAWGVKELYGAGFWHYRPRSGRLEPYPTGMPLNAWGTAFTNEGQPIMVAGAAGMYWARPMEISTSDSATRTLDAKLTAGARPFLLERFQLPYGGQSIKTEGLTKFCGIDIVGNSHWPESMQGEVITGGFFNNKVFRFQVRDDPEFPSGLETVEQEALLTSDSVAFRPVDVRFGPEGALYIADWYDPIIGHYQASFRHPNRDKAHGRIWRITAKGRELAKPALKGTKAKELAMIGYKNPVDRWSEYQAKRLLRSTPDFADPLSDFNTKVLLELERQCFDQGSTDQQRERMMLNLTHIYEAEERPDLHGIAWAFADAGSPPVKAAAVHMAGAFAHNSFDGKAPEPSFALELLKHRISDDSPRVRLEAIVAAAKVQSPEAIKIALKVLDMPMDNYLERALWLAVQATKKQWTPFAEVGVQALAASPPMREARGGSSDPSLRTQPSDSSKKSESASTKLVSAKAYTPTDPAKAFGTFLAGMPATHIAFLVKHDGSKELRDLCTAMLTQNDLPANLREGLTLALAEETKDGLKPEERKRLAAISTNAGKLADLASIGTTASAALRSAALAKLVAVDAPRAGGLVASKADGIKDSDALRQWLAPVLPVEAANKALVAALKAKPCTADTAKLIMRVLTSTGRSEPELMGVITGILGTSSPVPNYSPEFVNTLAAEVKAKGDAGHGKTIFNSTLVNCTACHSIAKKGGTIGPELDAVGRGVPIELLIEAVVWPNRQIKEGYIATTIKTKDGRVLQGYKVSDANGELQLRDLLSKTVTKFAANAIETRTDSGSLMPEGLVALMTREELRDLIAYLTTLGR